MAVDERKHHRGKLFVITGPSGVGKDTLLSRVMPLLPRVRYSISVTTRPPRPNEVNARDYFFVSCEEFKRMIANDEFLEWANVYGHLYGTPKRWVEEQLSAGNDVILEIDVQGALQVRKKCPDAVLIFISPPSMEELRRRITKRGLDSPDIIERRMKQAEWEMSFKEQFDYQIVNDDLDIATAQLKRILAGDVG